MAKVPGNNLAAAGQYFISLFVLSLLDSIFDKNLCFWGEDEHRTNLAVLLSEEASHLQNLLKRGRLL